MHLLVLGDSPSDLIGTAGAHEDTWRPAARLDLPAATLGWHPFAPSPLPIATPRLLRIDQLEKAFPNHQANGVRCVLTQPAYVIQKWLDIVAAGDRIVATASRDALTRDAPEILKQQGPWRHFSLIEASPAPRSSRDQPPDDRGEPGERSIAERLAAAFTLTSTRERLASCRALFDAAKDSEFAALALASAAREANDAAAARAALDAALALAPDWEAAQYEDGKFWLAADELGTARDRFRATVDRMPTFAAAWSNLGATLGELGDAEGALDAFQHALELDPDNITILNNLGVVNRESGRLERSEAALERVVALAPGFVFGHYNLGHTRFLRGEYAAALRAYEEGQRLDPEKNRRQGCRLAVVRFALGDIEGASRDLWRHADAAPPDEREDLLLEAYEIASALVNAQPALLAGQSFLTRIAAELTL